MIQCKIKYLVFILMMGCPLWNKASHADSLSAIQFFKSDSLTGDFNGNGIANPGEIITYTIELINGPCAFDTAIFRDLPEIPAENLVPGTVTSSTGMITQGNNPWDFQVEILLDTLAAYDTLLVIFECEIANPFPVIEGDVKNQAEVEFPGFGIVVSDDPETPGLPDPTSTFITNRPFLVAWKSGEWAKDSLEPGIANPGDEIRYFLDLANLAYAYDTTLRLVDTLSPWLELIPPVITSAGTLLAGTSPSDSIIEIQFDSIGQTDTHFVSFTVRVKSNLPDSVDTLYNQAWVHPASLPSFPSDDSTLTGDSNTTAIPARSVSILSMEKRVQVFGPGGLDGEANPGDTLSYSLWVKNTGRHADTLVLRDEPDTYSDLIIGSLSGGDSVLYGSLPGDALVFLYLFDLGRNDSVLIQFQVQIDDPLPGWVTEIENQASLNLLDSILALSDDPDLPGSEDPTIISVVHSTAISEYKDRSEVMIYRANPGGPIIFHTESMVSGEIRWMDGSGKVLGIIPERIWEKGNTELFEIELKRGWMIFKEQEKPVKTWFIF